MKRTIAGSSGRHAFHAQVARLVKTVRFTHPTDFGSESTQATGRTATPAWKTPQLPIDLFAKVPVLRSNGRIFVHRQVPPVGTSRATQQRRFSEFTDSDGNALTGKSALPPFGAGAGSATLLASAAAGHAK